MEDDFTPFNDEWKREVAKMTKREIIDMLAEVGIEKNELIEHIEFLKLKYNSLKQRINNVIQES